MGITIALLRTFEIAGITLLPELHGVLVLLVQLNVLLALFNLLPIPPLDGSRIADALMPEALRPSWDRFCTLGPAALLVIILLPMLAGFSPFGWILETVAQLLPSPSGG